MNGLPTAFTERLSQVFPNDQYVQLLNTFYTPKQISFRINTLKSSRQQAMSLLPTTLKVTEVPHFPHSYAINSEDKQQLTHSQAFVNGHIYIQNLSSMLPALLLAPSNTDRVLDITAAPGSKTTQLAALMQNQGWISAVEINKPRFHKLKNNLTLQGTENVHTYLMDGADVWRKCPQQFDKILVDAPCSSESRISALDEESYAYWSEKKIKEMCKKQKRLLFSAVLSLKCGGEIIYSTCSFAPEENEMAIHRLLKKFSKEIEIVPIELPIDNWQAGLTQWKSKQFHPDLIHSKRILPTTIMDGFYICKLRKVKSTLRA